MRSRLRAISGIAHFATLQLVLGKINAGGAVWRPPLSVSALLAGLLAVAPAGLAQTQVGASVPFVEFNAVTDGQSSGALTLGPNYNFGTIASEATGRSVLLLVGTGSSVSFTLTQPANAITVHYAIPDAPGGSGITAPLALYVNGANSPVTTLELTSAFSWLYGSYTFTKTPDPNLGINSLDAPHDFYNDVRYLFPSTMPAGTVVKLQLDPAPAGQQLASWYAINVVDFEQVAPPIPAPANAIDVTSATYGADKTGAKDSTTAIQNAIFAAQSSGNPVYLPGGTYTISNPLNCTNVTIMGAGEWYTVLTGHSVEFSGQNGNGTNINVSNLAIFGNVAVRNDSDGSVNGFNGTFSNSTLSNIWIQNTKVGAWFLPTTSNLTVDSLRIMDLKADGINFDGSVVGSTIKNTFIRNAQDDGIALWSQTPDTNDTITNNTVNSPGLANNIAIYGAGSGVVVSNNLLQDTVVRGGGIHAGQRFAAATFSGTLTFQNNKLVRTGQFDPGFFFPVGAVWLWALEGSMNSTINFTGNTIQDSPYSAFEFLGGNSINGVTLSNNTINNVGTYVVHANELSGSATFTNDPATGVGLGGFFNPGSNTGGACSPFTITTNGGDTGWSQTPPICNLPPHGALWVYPDVVTFAPGGSATANVAVINKAYETATLGAITASAGFTVNSSACGSSLQAAAFGSGSQGKCLVSVTFTGSTTGTTVGILSIPNGESSTPVTVQLIAGSGPLNGVNGFKPPTVPTLSGSTSSGALVLTWTASTGSTPISYNVYRGTSAGSETLLSTGSGVTATTFTDATALFPNTYFYYLKAVNPYGTSAASNEVSLSVPPPTPPSTPTGLTATASEGSIRLTWTASTTGSQPIMYNIYRGATSGGEASTPINSTPLTTTSYIDATVGNGATYFYEVAAVNAGGTSGKSNEATAITPNVVLQINVGTATPAGSYVADEFFNTGNEFSSGATINTAGVTNPAPQAVYQSVRWGTFAYTIPGLTANASYTVRLHFVELTWTAAGQRIFNVAINGTPVLTNFDVFKTAGGQNVAYVTQFPATATSSGQIVINFTPGGVDNPDIAGIELLSTTAVTPTAPSTPTGVTATAGSASVSLSWSASTGTAPITYSIFRGTSPNGENATAIAMTQSTTFSDSGLTNGTTYYYVVSASNSAGTSGKSSEVKATPVAQATAPSTPTGVTATAGSGSVSLSWSASTGTAPITYSIFRGTSAGGEGTTSIATTQSTTFSNSGLTNGTTYYYVVSASNSAGTSGKSSEVHATPTSSGGPFGGTPAAVPGTVQAENYDTGGQGVGYSVTSINGTGNSYRPDGVDLETTTDTGGGDDLGWTAPSQYFRYTVNVASAGTYTVSLRLAAPNAVTGALHISNSSGTNLSGSVNIPATGGYQAWTTVTASVTLLAGTQVLTLNEDNAGWNINFATFALATSSEGPFGGTPAAVPGTLQAENYDTGGQGVGYSVTSINGSANSYRPDGVDLETTTDTGGGDDLGWTAPSQYFRYTVNVASAGTYTVSLRLAAPNAVTGAFHISNSSGTNLSGPVNIPATGGYQAWTTLTATVTLPAGTQVLTLNEDNAGWNINYMTFGPPPPPPVVQIDSGSTTAVSPFSADTDFNTGNTFSSGAAIDLSHATNPAPAAVYQSCRFGASFTYTIPGLTPGKSYTVRLHFAELTWTAPNQRLFNVAVNGTNVLTSFDIFATAGAQNRAIVESSTAVASSSGTIAIAFTQAGVDNPEVNGIEVQ